LRLEYVDGSACKGQAPQPPLRSEPMTEGFSRRPQVFNAPYLRADGYAAVPLVEAGFAAGVLRRGLQLLPVFDHSLL